MSSIRGYKNKKTRAIMLWHSGLGGWCLDYVTNGKVSRNRSTISFESEKTKAITSFRKRGIRVPQSGWSKVKIQTSDLKQWNQAVLRAWNHA